MFHPKYSSCRLNLHSSLHLCMHQDVRDRCASCIMIPSFCVPKRYLPSRRNLWMSASPGHASVFLTPRTAKTMSGRYFKRLSEDAHASVVSSSILFTQTWLILVAFLTRLHNRGRHRFALVVAETQDVQNVPGVSLTWCNVDGVRIYHRSRCREVTVLRSRTQLVLPASA